MTRRLQPARGAARPARPLLEANVAPAALYRRVKDHVRRRIQAGDWRPGDRISSEHELVAALGVSRMTVNRALRELAGDGALVRVAGVGTFVAREKPQSGLLGVFNIADEIRARGHAYRCDVVRVSREAASAPVAAALDLAAGASVFHSICVHREDGVAVQLEDRWVNPAVAPDFAAQDFARRPPTEYLLAAVPLDDVEHVVDAVMPSDDEAKLLELRPSEPCLVLTRRTWTGGVPVTLVRCVHPGSRYRLGARFSTHGPRRFA